MRDQIRKALDFAMAKEREAQAFYLAWSEKVRSPAIRILFTELAQAERGHEDMLRSVSVDQLPATTEPVFDLGLAEILVEAPASPDMTLQQALALAMKREEGSVALYTRLMTFGGPAQAVFNALADEERRHKLLLEREYEEIVLAEN
ncbi:ferritin family protein [Candidatus Bipolaricaulota bacterium]|nr:ferritin family protein [Candidatus Bipolaricaulota bacterium]